MFWELGDTGNDKRLADSPDDDDIRFEEISCPREPKKHFRLGRRISPLSVVLPNMRPQDFVWTWGSECLVQEKVLKLLKENCITGYEAVAVGRVEFKRGSKKAPKLWEIVVTGCGGAASPASGMRSICVCPGCGLTDYTPVTEPRKVIDSSQWDGSDFFRVKGLLGFVFVTDRVVQALRRNAITGWRARSLSEMQEDFDIVLGVDRRNIN